VPLVVRDQRRIGLAGELVRKGEDTAQSVHDERVCGPTGALPQAPGWAIR
jgi:hypothetical protein